MTKQELLTQNLHWLGQKLTYKTKTRLIFKKIISELNFRPMIFLTGMRRVGKSVLIKQVLETTLENKKLFPEQFLFWEWHSKSTKNELEELIQFYLNEIANLQETVYIFFDEIQFIADYEDVIKLYFDRYENLRFVLTGSLSFSYKKRMSESLAGRFIEYRLLPLDFEEYLIFSESSIEHGKLLEARSSTNLNLKQGLAQNLNTSFKKFLKWGRFPDTLSYNQDYQIKNYLESILNQSLNQDSIDYFKITKPREIGLIYQYLAKNNGGEISLTKIGQNLGLSWVTINGYLDILELLGLVYPILNTDNPLKQAKARKKIYTNSAFGLTTQETILDNHLGYAVESYVLERFLAQKKSVFYFRERGAEVDLIDYNQKSAFEVKFRSKIEVKDYQNLLKIGKKLGLKPYLITLYQTFLDDSKISCLPACLI